MPPRSARDFRVDPGRRRPVHAADACQSGDRADGAGRVRRSGTTVASRSRMDAEAIGRGSPGHRRGSDAAGGFVWQSRSLRGSLAAGRARGRDPSCRAGADQNRTRAFDELVAKVHERIRQKNSAAPATVASGESAAPTNPAPNTGAARSPAVQIPVAAPASSAERTSFEQGAERVKCRPAQGSLISLLKLARVAYKLFQIPRPSREGRGGGSCPSQRFTPHPALSPRGKRGFETLCLAASPCLTHGAQSAALPAPAPTVVHREFSRAATLAAAPYGSLDCGSGAWLFACPPSRFAGEKGLGDQIR